MCGPKTELLLLHWTLGAASARLRGGSPHLDHKWLLAATTSDKSLSRILFRDKIHHSNKILENLSHATWAEKIKYFQEIQEAPVWTSNHASKSIKMCCGQSRYEVSDRARMMTKSDHVG